MIYISWFVLALVCGIMGHGRKIGEGGAFLVALIFLPIVGFIVVALSERKLKKPKTVEFLHHPKYQGRYVIESTHGEMVKLAGIAELIHMNELDRSSIQK